MRVILTISILLCLVNAYGQTKKTYNTKIDNANTVYIKNGNNIVIKSNNTNIGQIIVNQVAKPNVVLSDYVNKQGLVDKLHQTTLKIIKKEAAPFTDINIILKFNTSIDSAKALFGGVAYNIMEGIMNDEKTIYQLKATQMITSEIKITIWSKKQLFTNIYGIDEIDEKLIH